MSANYEKIRTVKSAVALVNALEAVKLEATNLLVNHKLTEDQGKTVSLLRRVLYADEVVWHEDKLQVVVIKSGDGKAWNLNKFVDGYET